MWLDDDMVRVVIWIVALFHNWWLKMCLADSDRNGHRWRKAFKFFLTRCLFMFTKPSRNYRQPHQCNIPWINLFWKHLELDSIKNQQYMTKFWSLAGILHTHICHCNSDSGDTCRWSKVQCAQSEKKCVEMLVSWQVQRSGVKNRSWMKKRYMTSTSEV